MTSGRPGIEAGELPLDGASGGTEPGSFEPAGRPGAGYDGLNLYLLEIRRLRTPDFPEEQALAHRARAGDGEARDRLVEGSLRLVVSLARPYAGSGVPLTDLIAEGNTGLLKAVERYDPGHGCRFSTYAAYWIRQAIFRALASQSRIVRIPPHLVEVLQQLARARHALSAVLGREPSADELAVELGLPVLRVQALLRLAAPSVSLHAEGPDGDRGSLLDRLVDPSGPEPGGVLAGLQERAHLETALAGLNARERQVIELRYGLADGTPRSRAEIGRALGVTREAVRQAEAKALRKLRHPARLRSLDDPCGG